MSSHLTQIMFSIQNNRSIHGLDILWLLKEILLILANIVVTLVGVPVANNYSVISTASS